MQLITSTKMKYLLRKLKAHQWLYRSSCFTSVCQLQYLPTKYSGGKATPGGCVSTNIWSRTSTLPYLGLRTVSPTNTKNTLRPL